jgi:DNA-binding GntR family transcriptional regulator
MSSAIVGSMSMEGPLAQRVYDHLIEGLFHRRIRPGELLNRRQVAKEVGVSLAPAAEAFVRLQAEGLLEPIGQKGTQVRLLRPKETRDQFILRMGLECQAVRLYCGEPLRRARKPIRELARRSDALAVNTPEDFRAEVELHMAMAQLSDCPPLVAALRQVLRIGLFLAVDMLLPPRGGQGRNHHVALVETLTEASPDQAEAIMRAEFLATLQLLGGAEQASGLSAFPGAMQKS